MIPSWPKGNMTVARMYCHHVRTTFWVMVIWPCFFILWLQWSCQAFYLSVNLAERQRKSASITHAKNKQTKKTQTQQSALGLSLGIQRYFIGLSTGFELGTWVKRCQWVGPTPDSWLLSGIERHRNQCCWWCPWPCESRKCKHAWDLPSLAEFTSRIRLNWRSIASGQAAP